MRENIAAVDEILDKYFSVLDDSGFLAVKDYMGSDASIIQAARNSYSKGTKKVSDDRTLLRRLVRDRHDSPTEFAEISFHLRAPLYIIQQILRHRTMNICSESHRFSEVSTDFQKTKPDEWRLQSTNNKQGSEGFLRTKLEKGQDYEDYWYGQELSSEERGLHELLKKTYDRRINAGIAREQARKDIPHSTYSSIYIKCDVRNLLHFLSLRLAPEAQKEIREYAHLIACVVKRFSPLLFEAWVDYSYGAKSFSRLDIEFLNWCANYLSNYKINDWEVNYTSIYLKDSVNKPHEKFGLTKRELGEFWKKLTPIQEPNFDLDLSKIKEFTL